MDMRCSTQTLCGTTAAVKISVICPRRLSLDLDDLKGIFTLPHQLPVIAASGFHSHVYGPQDFQLPRGVEHPSKVIMVRRVCGEGRGRVLHFLAGLYCLEVSQLGLDPSSLTAITFPTLRQCGTSSEVRDRVILANILVIVSNTADLRHQRLL